MKAIFFNDFGRLRSGWRFSIFLFLFLLATTLLGAALFTALLGSPLGFDQNSLLFLVAGHFFSFLCALVLGWLCGRFLENLPLRALGWTFSNGWLKHLIFGLAFGSLAILLAAAIGYVFGGMRFRLNETAGSTAIWITLAVSFVVFVIGSLSEETLFRGYLLQTFARSRLAWFAIVLTSLFFAFAHLGNPNANWISSLNTGIAGVTFGVAYLKTRTLWFPFALHFAWNWVQGAFLGITVSGLKQLITAPLLQPAGAAGPVWLTGGEYGIEGGIACTVSLVAVTLFIWFAPFFKPTAEMLALTNEENPLRTKNAESLS